MHTIKDSLGDRMKAYENISRNYLTRRIPVIIRIDGKAFHTFTRGFEKPFDKVFMEAMQQTMKYLCENIQGCVLGYTQSDEITLVLTDYANIDTDAWFGYNIQKMASVAASMATMAFNKEFEAIVAVEEDSYYCGERIEFLHRHQEALEKGAMFDARCFNIPKEEVCNAIYWRQLDATRNSIQMVGQAYFSQKKLQNKTCNQIQDMLHEQKGINWNDFPTDCKRGSCCIKETYYCTKDGGSVIGEQNYEPEDVIERSKWVIDKEIPIFINDDRKYIEKLINFD